MPPANQQLGNSPAGLRELCWVLAALAASSIPQFVHLPVWILLFAAAISIWRISLEIKRRPVPANMLRIPLAVLVLLGVYISFRTLNGPEAGAALLIVMAAMKLLEAHKSRDYLLLIFIAYFIMMANFFYSQSIPLALYTIPAFWIVLSAHHALCKTRGDKPEYRNLTATGRFLLPAVPVALILFVLFPRLPGPLWGVPLRSGDAISGLGNSMSPGEISHLALSDAVAFRVRFNDPQPKTDELYWRGPVLHHYDGVSWTESRLSPRFSEQFKAMGKPVRYKITLEPNNGYWLLGLDLPANAPQNARLLYDFQIISRRPVRQLREYQLTSYPHYTLGINDTQRELQRDLQLPRNIDPRARRLAGQWRALSRSHWDIVQKALYMFREQNFIYTLHPPQLPGRNNIDRFLFDSRRGFCEHYAGAFTFLMRAAGIPARVVTGYQGGEQNPLGDYLIVRQSDAHAWSEVWIRGRGWVRVDPTAAVAPSRVERGLASALPTGEAIPGGLFHEFALLGKIQLFWDTLDNGWNQWVLGYGPALQRDFLRLLGIRYGNWLEMALVMLFSVTAILGLVTLSLIWRSRIRQTDKAARYYAMYCKKLARNGIHRQIWEGPLAFGKRAVKIEPGHHGEIRAITELYIRLRYGPASSDNTLADFIHRVRQFSP